MHVKKYGIYIAWPPAVDLRAEGLGRHLAMFLKGASNLPGVRFTVVCPSWTKESIEYLARSEQLNLSTFDIVSPRGVPYVLKGFDFFRRVKNKVKRPGIISKVIEKISSLIINIWVWWVSKSVEVSSVSGLFLFACQSLLIIILLLVIGAIFIPFGVGIAFLLGTKQALKSGFNLIIRKKGPIFLRLNNLIKSPLRQGWVTRIFEEMQSHEFQRMHRSIEQLEDVKAWYCPTAFWPEFNSIKAPRLLCVPDVVLTDFPSAFSKVGGDRVLIAFDQIARTIRESDRFVTYSETVKWNTLIDRCGVDSSRISVVPHAPMSLASQINIKTVIGAMEFTEGFCEKLLLGAFSRLGYDEYLHKFSNPKVKFLFYASQLRPNKNVLTLLRAYEYLLRNKYIGIKLVLTGNIKSLPEVWDFVKTNALERDVVSLHGLTVPELAAFYKLAQLAVNPTLSEGGCPFTLTEALSVGTPAVMSKISVTEEVVKDPQLREMMLFDPYDWRDCAKRIEWALENRSTLLSKQLEVYDLLRVRTWTDVVKEHVDALDKIASVNSEFY